MMQLTLTADCATGAAGAEVVPPFLSWYTCRGVPVAGKGCPVVGALVVGTGGDAGEAGSGRPRTLQLAS